MARSQLQPRLIFLRAVDLLVENRIEVPGYPKLARLALAAVNRRRMELSRIIEHVLDDDLRKQLDLLLLCVFFTLSARKS